MKPVVLISGGSRGLGLGIAQAALQRGYRVATFARRPTPETQELEHLHPDDFLFLPGDMTEPEGFPGLIAAVEAPLGPVCGLVNNAGGVHEELLARQAPDAIDTLLNINLRGVLLLTRAVLRGMMVRGAGRIVTISSIVAVSGYKGTAAYSATKGGLDAMTRALAREVGGRNITVNSVAPGYMETALTAQMSQKHLQQIVRRTPLGRPGRVEDVVGPVLFLLSDEAAFMSGQTLVIDGGLTA